VWHASVALLGPNRKPIPIDGLGAPDLAAVRVACKRMLRGVGDGQDIWEPGTWAMHLKRRVHPRELDIVATDVRMSLRP